VARTIAGGLCIVLPTKQMLPFLLLLSIPFYHVCEFRLKFLQDQTDFLVVGIIGKQGVGKSTIMSLLSGNKFTDENRHMIFRPSAKDTRELAQHKTNGIQTFVTAERTILLDVQVVCTICIFL
jgi:translation initiation factor RLI1